MASPVLWLALGLLLAAVAVRREDRRRAVAAAGWASFAFYWGSLALFFLGYLPGPEARIDRVNAALSALMIPFSLFVAWRLMRGGSPALWKLTRATAFVGIVYFPFTEIPWLRSALIAWTDGLTAATLNAIGVPVAFSSPYLWVQTYNPDILPDGIPIVEIILACTAVESIALFGGVILAIGENRRRMAIALLATLPAIYLLNLVRLVFVTSAYAYNWFGPAIQSFEVAELGMAKIGSTLALIALAYVTFRILPEVATFIREVIQEFLPAFGRRPGPGSA